MKKLLVGISAILLMTSSAMAGFHVEPYVGYAKGSEGGHTETTTDQNAASYSGMGFGARLGISYLGVLFGGTYDAQGIEGTDDDSPNTSTDYSGTNIGAFLGYEFPLGLRVWGSYYMSSKLEVDNTTSAGAEFSGSGMSLGAGFSVIPMILSLNLEYKTFAYDEFTTSTGTVFQLTGNSEAKVNYLFVSISAPLGF